MQLSLQRGLDPAAHLAIGRALKPLRDEGVLILGSGQSYHNLRGFSGGGAVDSKAEAFDAWLRSAMIDGKTRDGALTRWENAPHARDAQPQEDHLLPLMVAAGAASGEPGIVHFHGHALGKPISGFRFGLAISQEEETLVTKLLVIETSPRGDQSISRNMTQRFVAEWQDKHPGGIVVNRDLAETELPFVNAPWLAAYFTPSEQHSPEMMETLRVSTELVAEILAADHLLIATPVYNYNVPASLKAWVDHIVRKGMTLGFDGKGLVTGKTATVIIASGGVYTEGSPIRNRDIATQYLRLILGVIGITDVTVVAGGNAKTVDIRETAMEEFIATLQSKIEAAAA